MTCNQTAVAVLQELCMKRKWSPPKYEVHDVTGPSNEPIFDVSVTLCNGIKGIGRGRQKRSAKHDAAQKALDQIQLRALPDADGSDISKTPVKQQGINPHEDIGGMNPVGELQYLCQQKHFPPPEYTVIGDEGEPHEKLFTYRCTVMQRNTTGTARKKQNSKHIAAKNMLDLLKSNWKPILDEIPDDPAVSSTFFQKGKDSSCLTELEKKKDFEHAQRFKMLKDLQDDIPSMPTISPGSQFSHYHIAYAAQLKQYNSVLEDPVFKEETNSFNKLKIICEKINFQISLTTDRGKNDTYIVFLQVNTDPPIIQAGHAEKLDMAIDQAATNTLEFLSIMAN